MKQRGAVVVLGGGVIGVTSAYQLLRRGWQVTLVERRRGVGLETSFANGGLITPSMADPWASPGLPRRLLAWLGREDSPFLVRPAAIPGLLSWGLKFLGQCKAEAWQRNTEATLRLCRHSHDHLKQLLAETGIDCAVNRRGTLHLFRDALSMETTLRSAEVLGSLGVRSRVLQPADCVALEPALAPQAEHLSGGIHYPDDEAGDAHLFTRLLAERCAAEGAVFRFEEAVQSIEVKAGDVAAVITDKDRIDCGHCLVALGNASKALLKPLGIRLPVYPVKGYSLSFPAAGWNGAPLVPFVDDGRKIGVVRIGDQVRVAGTAEFAGDDARLNDRRVANLRDYFLSLFPDCPHPQAARAWTGLRPTTPDGLPYLGATALGGLFINAGHGHLGWTMSCGAASLVAELISGEGPSIDLEGMTLETH